MNASIMYQHFLGCILYSIVPLLLLLGCSKGNESDLVTGKVRALESAYAPDRRVAIFDVEVGTRKQPVLIKGETQFPEALEELRNFMDTSGIAFVDSVEVLPSEELEGVHFGVVRVPVANMRSAPRHQAEMSTQALLGTPLKVWKKDGDWYYVQTPDGYLGWMDAEGFTPMKVDQYRAWQEQEKLFVTGKESDIYRSDDIKSQIVTGLSRGMIVLSLRAPVGGFHTAFLPDGRQGYLPEYHAVPFDTWLESRVVTDSAITETALSFMGVSYLWGGTSPYGFDCSGFTKMVFYLNGIVLPRDASQQVHVGENLGTSIDFQQWQPADLLFFGQPAKGDTPEKITHVAIYLGDGKFIHASGNVRIESLKRSDPDYAPHRYDTFVRAKRLVGTGMQNTGIRSISSMAEYTGE